MKYQKKSNDKDSRQFKHEIEKKLEMVQADRETAEKAAEQERQQYEDEIKR